MLKSFFASLDANVVFVVSVGLIVFGCTVGRLEYRAAQRAALETECALMSAKVLGQSQSPSADFVASLTSFKDICAESGGVTPFRKAFQAGQNAETKPTRSHQVEGSE